MIKGIKKVQLGLIGKSLGHSFSKRYFEEKFSKLNLPNHSYDLYELSTIGEVSELKNTPDLVGFNVTVPYKESVIPYLDELSDEAAEIGAVNTVKRITKEEKISWKGYNTDAYGFERMVKPFIKPVHERALILGTGGAAKAVDFVLKKKGIQTLFVSRTSALGQIEYEKINDYVMKYHKLIVNCTPVGMSPSIDEAPPLPYELITDEHTLIDLVYNPSETLFLQKGKNKGAKILNGEVMLKQQAEKAWEIWKEQ